MQPLFSISAPCFGWIVVFVCWINLIDLLVAPLHASPLVFLSCWTSLLFLPAPPYFVNSPPLCHVFVFNLFYFIGAPPTFDNHAPLCLHLSLGLLCYYVFIPLMFTGLHPHVFVLDLFVITDCNPCFAIHPSFTSCTSLITLALISYFCFPLLPFFSTFLIFSKKQKNI